MDEWKILKKDMIELDSNNFLEITLKEPPKDGTILVGISKGFITNDGIRRYKSNILFSKEHVNKVIDGLLNIDK